MLYSIYDIYRSKTIIIDCTGYLVNSDIIKYKNFIGLDIRDDVEIREDNNREYRYIMQGNKYMYSIKVIDERKFIRLLRNCKKIFYKYNNMFNIYK